jgi:hypothetical protein
MTDSLFGIPSNYNVRVKLQPRQCVYTVVVEDRRARQKKPFPCDAESPLKRVLLLYCGLDDWLYLFLGIPSNKYNAGGTSISRAKSSDTNTHNK